MLTMLLQGQVRHWRFTTSDENIANETPVMTFAHVGPSSKEHKCETIGTLHVIMGIDTKSKWVFAHMVPEKGHDMHAITKVRGEIITLLVAAKRERAAEAIEWGSRKCNQMTPESDERYVVGIAIEV